MEQAKPSTGLRAYFALECLFWLGWLAFDLLTTSAQLEIARTIPVPSMPAWIGLSVVVNVAMVASSALGVVHGRGVLSGRLAGAPRGVVLGLGIVLRLLLGLAMLLWLTTMSGAQSV